MPRTALNIAGFGHPQPLFAEGMESHNPTASRTAYPRERSQMPLICGPSFGMRLVKLAAWRSAVQLQGAYPDVPQPRPGSCLFPFEWFFHRRLAGMGLSASTAVLVAPRH